MLSWAVVFALHRTDELTIVVPVRDICMDNFHYLVRTT